MIKETIRQSGKIIITLNILFHVKLNANMFIKIL